MIDALSLLALAAVATPGTTSRLKTAEPTFVDGWETDPDLVYEGALPRVSDSDGFGGDR